MTRWITQRGKIQYNYMTVGWLQGTFLLTLLERGKSVIRFEHVQKNYGDYEALRDLSFEIAEGEFVVLIGPSGCGKTTTLKMINRLIEPDCGAVYINGSDTSAINRVELRRSIGYVIQQIGLFPNMTVAQNISVVPKLLKYDSARCDRIVHELLEMVDMSYDQFACKFPSELSGGQQQRIGVLRALAASPPIVLMDEPFGALDPITREVLQKETKRLQKKLKKTIVFVTHDMHEALILADKIIFMEEGRIAQMDSPENMLLNPADDIIRSFLGKTKRDGDQPCLTAADFMRTSVFSVDSSRRVKECTALMARHHVDSLVVVGEDEKYLGRITIDEIKKHAKPDDIAGTLPIRRGSISLRSEDARVCFDKLLSSGESYVVVLNDDETIGGIVTKTSMAEAMALALWGDEV